MGAIIIGLLIGAVFIYLDVMGLQEDILSGCLPGLVGFAVVLFISILLGAIHPLIGIVVFIIGCRKLDNSR